MWKWTNTRARPPQPNDVLSLPPDGAYMNGIDPSAVDIDSLDHNLKFVSIHSLQKRVLQLPLFDERVAQHA